MKKIIALLLVICICPCIFTSCITIQPPGMNYPGIPENDNSTETENLVNLVLRDAVLSGVIVTATFYSGFTKNETQGSGVIYLLSDGYYYVISNHHVAMHNGDNRNAIYSVIDPFDTVHSASLVAYSEELDLAVFRFSCKAEEGERLRVAPLATENPEVGTQIISVGNPGGLHNAVSMGNVAYYNDVDLDALQIPVIYHTAPLDHGSSGGGIYNSSGAIVGINYAIGQSEDKEATVSFAVPIEAVREFLFENGILPAEETETENQN